MTLFLPITMCLFNSTHGMQVAFLFSMKFPNNLPFKVGGYTFIKPVWMENHKACAIYTHTIKLETKEEVGRENGRSYCMECSMLWIGSQVWDSLRVLNNSLIAKYTWWHVTLQNALHTHTDQNSSHVLLVTRFPVQLWDISCATTCNKTNDTHL